MKYFIIIAATMLAYLSCTKEIQEINQETKTEGTVFVAGQKVTISCGSPQTRVYGTSKSDGTIGFRWESGDKIKVTVGDESSIFTLVSGVGTKSASFVGYMPASGTEFSIQYPATDPDLSSQTYSAGALPAGKMKFTASNCTLDAAASLTAEYAALRLNFYGYDRKVSSIVVTNTTSDPNETYTLNCSTSVRVPKYKSDAVPFLIVVPTGDYAFKVAVSAEEVYPAEDNDTKYVDGADYGPGIVITTGNFETTSEKTFTAGTVNNMSACCITTIWAPVNCGTETNHPYGKLYQYGRKVGCGYNDGSYFKEPQIQEYDNTTTDVSLMTDNSKFYANWRATEWSESNDPCPLGWRVPTLMELNRLLGGTEVTYAATSPSGYVNYGHWFNGTSTPDKFKTGSSTEYEGMHLIAAGGRSYENGSPFERATGGYYWASTPYTSDQSFGIGFYATMANAAYNTKAHAFSVRCVEKTAAACQLNNIIGW